MKWRKKCGKEIRAEEDPKRIGEIGSAASFLEKIGDFLERSLPPVFLLTRGKRGESFLLELTREKRKKWEIFVMFWKVFVFCFSFFF
jgi:hypothetical protein